MRTSVKIIAPHVEAMKTEIVKDFAVDQSYLIQLLCFSSEHLLKMINVAVGLPEMKARIKFINDSFTHYKHILAAGIAYLNTDA